MTDREKLIELLMDMPSGSSTYEEEEAHMEAVADYLLANGVTFATDNNVGGKMTPTAIGIDFDYEAED